MTLHSELQEIENVNRLVEDVTIAMFCLEEESLAVTPITADMINLLREIMSYLNQDDVVNALKLFLFSRGGDLHVGFVKYQYTLRLIADLPINFSFVVKS